METFDLDLLIRPNGLLLVRDARRIGAERLVSAAHRDGHLVRLRKGIYIPKPTWTALSRDDQYRARIEAAAIALRKDAVFSHSSAAALWGPQIAGPWPSDVQTRPAHRAGSTTGRRRGRAPDCSGALVSRLSD